MKSNVYVYIINKKTENITSLCEKAKSKYEACRSDFLTSLISYVQSGGKAKKDERLLVSFLILESIFDLSSKGFEVFPTSLQKDEYGKPFFTDTDVKIGISHNEDFVAVAYTKNRENGIDIEGEIDDEKAKRLSERFPQITSLTIQKSTGETDEFFIFEMTESGAILPLKLTSPDDAFTAKWTAAEAIMKCDGRGFSALTELQKIKEDMKVFTFSYLCDDKKNYISLAIKKQ